MGCVIAPLVAPLVMLLIMLLTGEDLRGPSYRYGLHDVKEVFGIAGMFLILGAPIAWGVMVILGLPAYFLAQKLGFINFWSVTFGSAFVSILPWLVMYASNGFVIYEDPEKSSFLFYLAFAFIGYMVGLVFWFVGGVYKHSAHNNRLKHDAQKTRAS